ncbi:MAG TPA: hypothetical protein VM240_11430 [Verrucomicrobiae bacterium]|nr:hypothetical protein [Verrucomicrobiae bacterium]
MGILLFHALNDGLCAWVDLSEKLGTSRARACFEARAPDTGPRAGFPHSDSQIDLTDALVGAAYLGATLQIGSLQRTDSDIAGNLEPIQIAPSSSASANIQGVL